MVICFTLPSVVANGSCWERDKLGVLKYTTSVQIEMFMLFVQGVCIVREAFTRYTPDGPKCVLNTQLYLRPLVCTPPLSGRRER